MNEKELQLILTAIFRRPARTEPIVFDERGGVFGGVFEAVNDAINDAVNDAINDTVNEPITEGIKMIDGRYVLTEKGKKMFEELKE